MKLKYQLFVILLLASAALIVALFLFNSWSFNRGFSNYLNRSQTASLESLADELAERYAQDESWAWLIDEPAQWRRLSHDALRDTRRQPRREPSQPDGPPKRPERGPPLVLADAEKQLLLGRVKSMNDLIWIPVGNLNEPVGYLGYRGNERLPRQLDQVFAEQQKKSFALASLLMVGLSALLAALLASRIVKPVIKVSQAVSEISRGDYTQRVTTSRRDELGDLSRDVNQLASTLEHSRHARRKWIAEISHELRTPLAILQGEIEAIEDGIRTFDAASLESLQAETLRLSRLVNDLHDLSLSDLGALGYSMAHTDMAEVLRERLTTSEHSQREKSLSVELNAPSNHYPIVGDEQRLGQLVDNLLQNSIRYTDPHGKIVITLWQSAEHVSICWMDSAPGVSDADLAQLFDPLYRAEQSRNRNHGGAGLGLAIAQKIVEAHQGVISVAHSPLGGVQIDMQFPVAQSPSQKRSI